MNLYIKNHPDEIVQPWWSNFESTLVDRYVGTEALRHHIEDRRKKLDAYNAILKWDKESGLPYLHFENKNDAVLFILKWS